jgi:hypothetical protein
MPLEANEWNLLAALLVAMEFACLALLGFILVQLMHLEASLANHKDRWLQQIRLGVKQLRMIRRKLDNVDGKWPGIPLGPSLKRKWTVFRWVCKALSAAKLARS